MMRKLVSITLGFSFIALGSSGILMIILDSFAFQLQMHPVHKIFGFIMVIAGCIHVYLNFKPIKHYLKDNKMLILSAVLSVVLFFLFFIGMNKPLDQGKIEQIQQIMSQMGPEK